MGDLVTLFISCSASSVHAERRFSKALRIADLKGKLELVTGAPAGAMNLILYGPASSTAEVCRLDDDEAMLGAYPVADQMRIHVQDTSSRAGDFADTSKVEKFELTAEEYAQRTDTVRSFKERNKLGRFDQDRMARLEAQEAEKEAAEKALVAAMKVGDRCEVKTSETDYGRRGTILYIGCPEFKPGYFVGVKLDEPVGKNDGSVEGVRYFKCEPKYGVFVRPAAVTVGDFPEEDIDLEDDEM